MTTGATGQLGLALPVQGELSGTWGDTVNNGITQYTNIAIAATLTLTNDGAVTLANTTGDASASNIVSTLTGAGTVTAQFAIVRVTGTLTTAKVVTAPSYSKTYIVVNAATGGIVTFKASGQTGVSIAVGESAWVYYNGTDYVKISSTAITSSQWITTGSDIYYNTGNVGIGTSTPASKLHLQDTTQIRGVVSSSTNSVQFWKDATPTFAAAIGCGTPVAGLVSALTFELFNGSSWAESMRLNSTGLGVGTSSPSSKLDVSGTGTIATLTGTGVTSYLKMTNTGQSSANGFQVQTVNEDVYVVNYSTAGNIFFSTNGSANNDLTIDSAGNLGLGTAPSAWGALRGFDITAGAALAGANNLAYLTGNCYFNGTNWIYKASAKAAVQETGDGVVWKVAASGTAGNAITFTQAMTLDASGNFTVGDTISSGRITGTKAGKGTFSGIDTTASAAGVGGTLDLGGNYRPTGDYQPFVRVSAEKANGTDADYGYNMAFYTTTNGGSSMANRVITLLSTGAVAFGTSNTNYGTSGQVLKSNGSGAAPSWAAASAGGFGSMEAFTSSTTWTVPTGITKCKVTVTGGGGGGMFYCGGGSGGTAIAYVTLSGSSATITVGSGGGAGGGSSGTAGGNSSFVYGATTVTGNGGGGGNSPGVGQGGSSSGGTVNSTGGTGLWANGNPNPSAGFYGGSATNSTTYGGGGAGVVSTSYAGGTGLIIIEY